MLTKGSTAIDASVANLVALGVAGEATVEVSLARW
jgi:hypothetical protein